MATNTTSISSTTPSLWKRTQPFVFGGAAGMFATCCIQPIDMVKVQIQLSSQMGSAVNPINITKHMIREHGVLSLYNGLSAGLLRQVTYTTSRLGIFYAITDEMKKRKGSLNFRDRALAGLVCGGVAAVISNPCDLSLIRIQADTVAPVNQRKNYTSVFNALFRITKQEGIFSLWRGSFPTVVRASALNLGMLATYDETKDRLEKYIGTGIRTNLCASAVSGFFASACSLPFDFLRVRIQRQKVPLGENPMGFFEMAIQVTRQEGLRAFYKGFTTYYARIAPHCMITLLAMEGLKTYCSDLDLTALKKKMIPTKE